MPKQIFITNCSIYQGRGKVLTGQSILVEGSMIRKIAPLSELRDTYGVFAKSIFRAAWYYPVWLIRICTSPNWQNICSRSIVNFLPKADLLERIRQKAAASTNAWLLGYGWNQNLWILLFSAQLRIRCSFQVIRPSSSSPSRCMPSGQIQEPCSLLESPTPHCGS